MSNTVNVQCKHDVQHPRDSTHIHHPHARPIKTHRGSPIRGKPHQPYSGAVLNETSLYFKIHAAEATTALREQVVHCMWWTPDYLGILSFS